MQLYDRSLIYKVWTSLVGGAPIDDQVKVIDLGPLLPLEPPAKFPNADAKEEGKESSEDEFYATAAGGVKKPKPKGKPKTGDDPYSAFENWLDENEDMDY